MPLAAVDGLYAVSLAFLVALVYLALVRLVDLNEKEPFWAISLAFVIGVAASVIFDVSVGSTGLALEPVWGPVVTEAVRFLAVGATVLALRAIGRVRGWSEVSGMLDGIVYGVSVGLGFAVGAVLVAELNGLGAIGASGGLSAVWPVLLLGLSQGVYGGIIGAGFGAAAERPGRGVATMSVIGAGVLAMMVHVAHDALGRGTSGAGNSVLRGRIALALPALAIAVLVVAAILRERRAIREQLPSERETGAIEDADLAALSGFFARRAAYARRFFGFDFDGWLDLRALHNRQVQLAITKARAARLSADDAAAARAEADRLRAAILELKLAARSETTAEVGA